MRVSINIGEWLACTLCWYIGQWLFIYFQFFFRVSPHFFRIHLNPFFADSRIMLRDGGFLLFFRYFDCECKSVQRRKEPPISFYHSCKQCFQHHLLWVFFLTKKIDSKSIIFFNELSHVTVTDLWTNPTNSTLWKDKCLLSPAHECNLRSNENAKECDIVIHQWNFLTFCVQNAARNEFLPLYMQRSFLNSDRIK